MPNRTESLQSKELHRMLKSDQPKINRTSKSNGLRRWDQIEDKQHNKWQKVFKDKFKHFKDKWTLRVSVECPNQDEWENSLEERLSMTCNCKDCGHVWVTDTGASFFYYSIFKSASGGNEGKALLWVKPDLCPNKESCSSLLMSLMDVHQGEVEAVVSYLTMHIGWSIYGCQYTEDHETSIENQRQLRLKKMKKAEKSKAVANKESTKSVIAIRKENVVSRDQSSSAKPIVKEKLRNPKPNMTQADQTMDIKRFTKKKTRWDTTEEQIKSEWELSFRSKFDGFTEKNPSHKWIMSLEKVTKKHPLRREERWEHFLGEQVEAGFRCPDCNYTWESKRAWISFWILQNPLNSEGKRIGEVAVHILGQKCWKCPGTSNMKEYHTGDLQSEEIDVVLSFLYMEIDHFFYDNFTYTHQDEVAIEKARLKAPVNYSARAGHRKELCQPCQQKVCKKKVRVVYPGTVEATLG